MSSPFSLGSWWKEWQEGDRIVARQLAETYVDEHREILEPRFGHMTQEECVALVGVYKKENNPEQILTVKIWVMSEFEPQKIGGKADIVIRRGQK